MRIPANQPFDAGAHNIEVVVGSVASDYLRTSSAENVTFYGNGGNDTLLGGSGNDILAGGAGADRLSGGNGRDTAFYGAALGGVSVDLMAGTGTDGEAAGDILESIENVIGSSFADTILGNGVSNDITGGAGNDYVDAAAGDDIVRGGTGADTLIGGAGIDALDYTSSTEAVQVDLAAGTGLGGDAEGDVVSQFEIVLGSGGSDVLSGDAGNELLDGGEGDDLLYGREGNDDLIGGVGNDTLIGGLGADNLDGGDGFDWASYADAAEGVAVRLDLGKGTGGEALGDLYSGIEAVAGSASADTIIGDGNANHIRGGAGSDRLDGGSGNDILSGGDGDDVIVGGIGADTIDGGAGVDVVDYAASNAGIHISLADGTGSGGLAEGDQLTGIENVVGSAFDDTLIGNDDDNVFKGGSGNDTFIGGAGEDTFVVDGDYRDYQLVHGDDGYATLSGTDGTDILQDVENVIIGGRSFYGDQNNSPAFFGSKHVTTDEDAVTLISKESLLTEFYDLEGDSFSISAVSDATHGAVSIVGDDVRFIPVANYNGPASFKYTVTDENGAAHIYEVGMTINAVNDAPTAYISGNRMVASDVDGDALSYSIIGRSSGVSAGIDGNGNFSYSASGYGDFSFTMRASDGHGAYVDRSFSFTKEQPEEHNDSHNGDDDGGSTGGSTGGGSSGGGDPGCFVAGTPVLMASGLTKPIEDVVRWCRGQF
jgi:Ca2+-binding RTX toxin-like protein